MESLTQTKSNAEGYPTAQISSYDIQNQSHTKKFQLLHYMAIGLDTKAILKHVKTDKTTTDVNIKIFL